MSETKGEVTGGTAIAIVIGTFIPVFIFVGFAAVPYYFKHVGCLKLSVDVAEYKECMK